MIYLIQLIKFKICFEFSGASSLDSSMINTGCRRGCIHHVLLLHEVQLHTLCSEVGVMFLRAELHDVLQLIFIIGHKDIGSVICKLDRVKFYLGVSALVISP